LLFLLADKKFRLKYRKFIKICAAVCCVCIISILGSPWFKLFNNFNGRFQNLFEIKQRIQNLDNDKYIFLNKSTLNKEWNYTIGNSSIQTLPYELSYAAANNWTGWQPNPVLQLYSAYSKKLDELSAASFSRQKAPDFILFEYNTIDKDKRNILLDTPATWNTILPNYDISLMDKNRLLLKKKSQYKNIVLNNIKTEVYTFEEAIKIPETEGLVFAKIKITTTFLGKIITVLFRGNPSDITIKYGNGEVATFRIISDTLQTPVLINYVPRNIQQFAALFLNHIVFIDFLATTDYSLEVKQIAFSNKFRKLYYKNDIEIEWFEAKEL